MRCKKKKSRPDIPHVVKTLPQFYSEFTAFSIRLNDRDYQKDDLLISREWDPDTGYTGRICCWRIRRCSQGILDERFPRYEDIIDEWDEELDGEEQEWLSRQNPCFFCDWGFLCK